MFLRPIEYNVNASTVYVQTQSALDSLIQQHDTPLLFDLPSQERPHVQMLVLGRSLLEDEPIISVCKLFA